MLLVFTALTLFVVVARCNFVMVFLDHYVVDLWGYIPLSQMYKSINYYTVWIYNKTMSVFAL
jgi:hypothetical protein